MKVKIFGAGSIGNHLANAARVLGWSVDLCDVDGALEIRFILAVMEAGMTALAYTLIKMRRLADST